MNNSAEHLHQQLERVRHLSGAVGASAFLPSPWFGAADPILLHAGAAAPVAELQDLAHARQFHGRHLASAGPEAATRDLRVVPSETPGAVLLPVPAPGNLATLPPTGVTDARRQSDQVPVALAGWLSLRFDDGTGALADPGRFDLHQALGLAGSLARTFVTLYSFGNDPLTGLPGRAELHGSVRQGLQHASALKRPLSVLLVNPDRFETINEQFGRAAGDQVLREVVVRMQGALRAGDTVLRYGAAIFGLVLPGTGLAHASAVAEKVRRALSGDSYLGGRVDLQFSAGLATWQPGDDALGDPVQLVQRADLALAAARSDGGGRSHAWTPESVAASAQAVDRLGGVFTGDQNKDYRNLSLLWDALTTVWSGSTPAELARRFAEQLFTVLRPAFVGVYDVTDGAVGSALATVGDDDAKGMAGGAPEHVSQAARDVLRDACAGRSARYGLIGEERCALALPVIASAEMMGAVLMIGDTNRFRADVSDFTFLEGFAAGMGVALDRARLAEQERERSDRERRRLAGELKELRSVLRQVKLVYQSQAVEDVVFDAKRVADTDATVLITGESGTGKGLLAETIHQVSRRRGKPFIIVDCGAIPPNLLESELFGHERGAFTGAITKNPGRIAQADGGTLLLDEVGEVPLDMQAKLLRFVEAKHFTSVGSPHLRHVDVRVIAATNRDLEREVAAGRFRLDLYHRLSVVPLELPPLRRRHEDVILLAQHYLDAYAAKYQKPVHTISPELTAHMLAYSWPGNIRELQNRLLRAVLLADDETLMPAHMVLPRELTIVADTRAGRDDEDEVAERPAPASGAIAAVSAGLLPLRDALARAVAAGADMAPHLRPPLGRWLADDLVLAAFHVGKGVASRAAAIVGLPDTTYARRLQRAQRDTGLSTRPTYWSAVSAALLPLVREHQAAPVDTSLLDVVESWLLVEIDRRCPNDARAGAALLGTSVPTFRRRTTSLDLAS